MLRTCVGGLEHTEAVRFDRDQVKVGDFVFVHCETEATDGNKDEDYTYQLPLSLGKVVKVTTGMEGAGESRILRVVSLDLVYQKVEQEGDVQFYENRWGPWIVPRQKTKNALYKEEGMGIEFIRPIKVEVSRVDKKGRPMKEGSFVLQARTLGQLSRDKFGEINSSRTDFCF
jgi:hypothetical protein